MKRLFSSLLALTAIERDSLQEIRERALNVLLFSGVTLGTLIYAFTVVQNLRSGKWGLFPVYTIAYIWVLLVTLWRRIPYLARALTLPIVLYLLGITVMLDSGLSYSVGAFLLGFIIISNLFLGVRGGFLALLFSVLSLAIMGVLASLGSVKVPYPPTPTSQTELLYWTIGVLITILIGIIMLVSATTLIRGLNTSLRQTHTLVDELTQERMELATTAADLERRLTQIRTTAEISRIITTVMEPQQLLQTVVDLLQERFGLYYAAVFLIDQAGEYATLQAATAGEGRLLKESKHRLEVGGKSMVGAALHTRKARIALDVGADAVRFENPILPYTRSEIALPLIVGERVLGALDLQSGKEAAFSEQDTDALQGMANQVAIAIENARLFQEAQQSLEEIRAVHRQYLQTAWSGTAQAEGSLEYAVGSGEDQAAEGMSAIDIPLTLREQIIGQITLEGEDEWTPEEKGWIEAVATQAALALENARLLEESQQLALRERLVAEITGKIWASITIDGILQTTVKELGRVFNTAEATIELALAEEKGARQ